MDRMLEIDLIDIAKRGLNINEYLTILKIHLKSMGEDIPYSSSDEVLYGLLEKGFVDIIDDKLYLNRKAEKIFRPEVINFDELYFLYPAKTPDRRDLRNVNKEVLGHLTKDYETLSKKYFNLIKNVSLHEKVIEFTKRMLNEYKAKNKLNYLPKLETYINQHGWERYSEEDNDILTDKRNYESI